MKVLAARLGFAMSGKEPLRPGYTIKVSVVIVGILHR